MGRLPKNNKTIITTVKLRVRFNTRECSIPDISVLVFFVVSLHVQILFGRQSQEHCPINIFQNAQFKSSIFREIL
jgi:hypothetical protein